MHLVCVASFPGLGSSTGQGGESGSAVVPGSLLSPEGCGGEEAGTLTTEAVVFHYR